MTKKGNIPNEKKRRKIMKAKKLLAVLMTAAVLTGTAVGSVTTFAAALATITVNGLNDAATFKYLKVVEPDTTSPLGWKIISGYADEFMTAFDVDTEEKALQALIALGSDTNAEFGMLHTSTELAAALSSLIDEVADNGTTGVNGKATVDTAGLYVIVATANDPAYTYVPMMAYVGDTGEGTLIDATVMAKGSYNIINKDLTGENKEDNESVSAGDIVEFTAQVTYPFYPADATNTEFFVEDTLTNGTFVADSVQVVISGQDAAPGYELNSYADTAYLKVDFSKQYNSSFAGKEVVITYKAKVGEGEGDLQNGIKTNIDQTGDYVTLGKVQVKVLKTAGEKKLEGATFEIYEAASEKSEGFTSVENASVVNPDGAAIDPQHLFLKKVDTEKVTDQNGSLTFVGLDADKTYYVKETIAPAGYTVNPNYYLVSGAKKDDSSTDDVYVFTDFDDISVDDSKISALPSTGGIGTTIFTIGGCVIMIAAAGLFFASRRKEEK